MSRWASLLAVQEHDTRADQLNHRIQTLPFRADLARLEEDVMAVDRQLADAQRRREELARSQQRLEDEIASLTERANQAEKQLYSGAVTNPRELQALQDDVASIRRRIRQLEDDELEIMELVEPVDAERSDLVGRRDQLDAQGQRLRAQLAEAESELEAELAEVQSERSAVAADVSEELWPEYDKLRARLGGVAIARLVGSTCQGCHLALSAVEVDRIRKLSLDEAVHCEECGRLLVRD
ncbi:MAG TPA: C4-type zinc ribbon domain-containing protein [Acidimicrobiales bacterium]|nr:C4-type zinc ribbon domain-containing protein [Acidimicrobiales bacterium]